MLEKIKDAVLKSSQIMLEAEHIAETVEDKGGHANFVTEYDKRVQEDIFERLAAILPEAKFMGEEEEAQTFSDKGYLFIIDPIDGTTNFIKNYKASCLSVGLLKDGEPLLGVVYNPYRKEMFYAQKGKGAYLNGKPIHVSGEPLSNGLILWGTSPYDEDLWQHAFELAYYYFTKGLDLRRSGSAAIDLCDIACGRAEIFFELRLRPWDYAAGALIVQEAGGNIIGADKKPLQYASTQGVFAFGSGVSLQDIKF